MKLVPFSAKTQCLNVFSEVECPKIKSVNARLSVYLIRPEGTRQQQTHGKNLVRKKIVNIEH